MRRILVIALVAVFCMTGCAVPKQNEPASLPSSSGQDVLLVSQAAMEIKAARYTAPARLEYEMTDLPDDLRIIFDAEIVVPESATYPIYLIENYRLTQDDANLIIDALLQGAQLYEPTAKRSRREIQASIDYYEKELASATEQNHENLISNYQQILKDLQKEYDESSEDVQYQIADRTLKFRETDINALNSYGREVPAGNDGGYRFEWTDEGRQRAIADGCESISGIHWTPDGRKMTLEIWNSPDGSGVNYQCEWINQTPSKEKVTFSEAEAIAKAQALVERMGCDFVPIEANALIYADWNNRANDILYGYTVLFARNYYNAPQKEIGFLASNQSFGSAILPETIAVTVNNRGINGFNWKYCKKQKSVKNENAELMPFDKVKERIEQQLRVQDLSFTSLKNDIVGRRLVVDKLVLSYMQVALPGGAGLTMIPVWDVCGDLYYKYNENETGYVLDENREYETLHDVIERENGTDYSVLTINALNGSTIDRSLGY